MPKDDPYFVSITTWMTLEKIKKKQLDWIQILKDHHLLASKCHTIIKFS